MKNFDAGPQQEMGMSKPTITLVDSPGGGLSGRSRRTKIRRGKGFRGWGGSDRPMAPLSVTWKTGERAVGSPSLHCTRESAPHFRVLSAGPVEPPP